MVQRAPATAQLALSATAQEATLEGSAGHQSVSHLVQVAVFALVPGNVFAVIHLVVHYARQNVSMTVCTHAHAFMSLCVFQ